MEIETIRKVALRKFKKLKQEDKLENMQKRIDFYKLGIEQNNKTKLGLSKQNEKLDKNIEDIEMLIISHDTAKFQLYFL